MPQVVAQKSRRSGVTAAISSFAVARIATTQREIDSLVAEGERIVAEIETLVAAVDEARNEWQEGAATRELERERRRYAEIVAKTGKLIAEVRWMGVVK